MINLYAELPSVADWLVVLFSFIGICIAEAGLILAFDTVNDWKKQKEWDIVLEALANAPKSLNYYYYLVSSFKRTPKYSLAFDVSLKEEDDDWMNLEIKKESLTYEDRRYLGFDSTIFLIEKKLNHIYRNQNNEIKEFYNLIIEEISKREKKAIRLQEITDKFITDKIFKIDMSESEKLITDSLKKEFFDLMRYLLNYDNSFINLMKSKITELEKLDINEFINKKSP